MSQWWLVGPVVLIAMVYVCRSLLPRSWRRKGTPLASGSGCHDCSASDRAGRGPDGAPVKR